MKIKLTKRWKQQPNSLTSIAWCRNIKLQCKYEHWLSSFHSIVSLMDIERTGLTRKSAKAAQQDAERLAVELLLDIRDGTKALMEQHGISEDD